MRNQRFPINGKPEATARPKTNDLWQRSRLRLAVKRRFLNCIDSPQARGVLIGSAVSVS